MSLPFHLHRPGLAWYLCHIQNGTQQCVRWPHAVRFAGTSPLQGKASCLKRQHCTIRQALAATCGHFTKAILLPWHMPCNQCQTHLGLTNIEEHKRKRPRCCSAAGACGGAGKGSIGHCRCQASGHLMHSIHQGAFYHQPGVGKLFSC